MTPPAEAALARARASVVRTMREKRNLHSGHVLAMPPHVLTQLKWKTWRQSSAPTSAWPRGAKSVMHTPHEESDEESAADAAEGEKLEDDEEDEDEDEEDDMSSWFNLGTGRSC